MTIFPDNKLLNAELEATNENLNYPITNIIHRYLTKVFRTSTTSSTVTITFNNDYDIDYIIIGYHNLSSGTARLKSSVGTLLDTITLDTDNLVTYFTQVDDVGIIEIDITTDETYCEIGNISAGLKLEMPNSDEAFRRKQGIRSTATKTDGGQLIGRRKKKLKGFSFTIPYLSLEELEVIESALELVQTVNNIWVDIFEQSHDKYLPLYCNITEIQDSANKNYGYNFGFSIEESF